MSYPFPLEGLSMSNPITVIYVTLGANDFLLIWDLNCMFPLPLITRRAIAEEFARLGAHVWVCARTSEDLEKCLAEYASATWSGSIHGSVLRCLSGGGSEATHGSSHPPILLEAWHAGESLPQHVHNLYVTLSVKENHNLENCSIDVYDLCIIFVLSLVKENHNFGKL